MQKAMIVKYDLADGVKKHEKAQDAALAELNDLLQQGWRVVHAYPMSGHHHTLSAVSLVIIEK